MIDWLPRVLDVFARFVIPMGFFALLADAVIFTLVVLLLGYYLVRFLSFAISWYPNDLVGAPRNRLFSDSSAIPDLDAKEDRESQSATLSMSRSDKSSSRSENTPPVNRGGVHLIGALTGSMCGGLPQRDVKIVITPTELFSEISEPSGRCAADAIDYFEIRGLRGNGEGPVTLTFVLTDQQRVRFYATLSKFDMVILLDQIVAKIGHRRREFPDDA